MKKAIFIAVLLICCVGAAGWYFFLTDKAAPELALAPETEFASVNVPFTVAAKDASGIRQLKVTAIQGQKEAVLVDKTYDAPVREATENFDLKGAGFADGPLAIQVEATDRSIYNFGAGNKSVIAKTVTMDSTPPAVSVDSLNHIVRQGGAAFVVYSVSEEPGKSGVKLGDAFYPGYKLKNGKYATLFPFPYDMDPAAFTPVVIAADKAGNESGASFRVQAIPRKFKSDKINLSDNFLQSIRPQFQSAFPDVQDPLELYLKVNNDMRRDNRAKLKEIAKNTAPEMLWDKAFLRLPNSAPRAGYADERTYVYQGRDVDKQTHLGVDLASLSAAEVPAANDGTVVFTGPFGIYGNAVILDHGMGLQTLYAHLSKIGVKEGDQVKKGQTIGHTGATGLAGGDHLHFGVLIDGIPVTPVEWWDQHWIDDNVTNKF